MSYSKEFIAEVKELYPGSQVIRWLTEEGNAFKN